ncbi:hypothetical protein FRC18_009636 [Serendipita sp. 400]|nr:hypothetical protein FRC18_009636 [Serendipita sp. 400]
MEPIHSHQDSFQPPTGLDRHGINESDRQGTLQMLKDHLQAAVQLELMTIPAYLYAAYSVKSPLDVKWSILKVVKEEMLHLGLAGKHITPNAKLFMTYATTREYSVLYRGVSAPLLCRASPGLSEGDALWKDSPEFEPRKEGKHREFYEARATRNSNDGSICKCTIRHLQKGSLFVTDILACHRLTVFTDLMRETPGDTLIIPETKSRQFKYEDGSWDDENMIAIEEMSQVPIALNTIISQGEGSKEVTIQSDSSTPHSHFQVFKGIFEPTETVCQPVPDTDHKNPKTSDLKNEKVHKVLLLFDAAYCYLLITVERMWDPAFTDRDSLITNNLRELMVKIMRPLAEFLVHEEDSNDQCFAPLFRFYDFPKSERTCHDQLKDLMKEAMKAYEGEADKVQQLELVARSVKNLLSLQPYCHRPRPQPTS